MYVCTYVCMYVNVYMNMYKCVYILYAHIHIYIYIYMYIIMCIYIYIYTYNHIYIYIYIIERERERERFAPSSAPCWRRPARRQRQGRVRIARRTLVGTNYSLCEEFTRLAETRLAQNNLHTINIHYITLQLKGQCTYSYFKVASGPCAHSPAHPGRKYNKL